MDPGSASQFCVQNICLKNLSHFFNFLLLGSNFSMMTLYVYVIFCINFRVKLSPWRNNSVISFLFVGLLRRRSLSCKAVEKSQSTDDKGVGIFYYLFS
jgi:hypothetical protein